MRKKILLLSIIFLICFLTTGCLLKNKSATTTNKEFKNYDNPTAGISVNYPANWTLQENYLGATAFFITPKESESDPFQENIGLMIQDLGDKKDLDLKAYAVLSESQIKQYITNAQMITNGEITWAGSPAYKFVYTGEQGTVKLKWLQYFTLKNSKAYVFTFTAEETSFDKFAPLAEKMAQSFIIK